jgi:hypothetical protein
MEPDGIDMTATTSGMNKQNTDEDREENQKNEGEETARQQAEPEGIDMTGTTSGINKNTDEDREQESENTKTNIMVDVDEEVGEKQLSPSPEEAEEEATAQATEQEDPGRPKRMRRLLIVLLGVLLLTGLIVGLAVGLTTKDNNSQEEQTDPKEEAPSTPETKDRSTAIQNWLLENESSNATYFDDPSSPQSRALNFLALTDELQLDTPPGDTSTELGYAFLTRYVMSVLYYSTGGPQWNDYNLFLSKEETCDWFFVQRPPVGQTGVLCDPNTNVIHGISFSKFVLGSSTSLAADCIPFD